MIPRHVVFMITMLSLASMMVMAALGSLAFTSLPDQLSADLANEEELEPAVLIGAGDISVCGQKGDERTARLIERLLIQFPQAQVFTTGDNVQIMGEIYEYTHCFHSTWGRFQERIHPSPGNHDWYFNQGDAYFDYFGAAAGERGVGYYSYNLGDWHIVSLNSNCEVQDCGPDSPQAQWLRADLEQASQACALLYWHHPLWTSGTVPVSEAGKAFWQIASEAGADIVVNGHDHHYERFAPLDASGNEDPALGTRVFIAGTGGAWLFDLADPLPITEARDNSTLGVMVFLLYPTWYEWYFVPAAGGQFSDSGSGICH